MRLHSIASIGSIGSPARLLASGVAALFALPVTGVAFAQTVTPRPCDLFGPATPCVAAISTTRALYKSYKGPLYQVTRASDTTRMDIGLLPDGYANAATQDTFCADSTCTITKLYDQSPKHNDLTLAPPGGAARGRGPEGYDVAVIADALPVIAGGHKVYGMSFSPGMGYRNDHATGTAVNDQAEGVYMLTSALHVNHKCCFDFGNAEINDLDNGHGHMDAINIKCRGRAPGAAGGVGRGAAGGAAGGQLAGPVAGPEKVQAPCAPDAGLDMENGIPGHLPVPPDTRFATVMGINDGRHTFAMFRGNGQGGGLTTTGTIPLAPVYQPMKLEGAIILGIGGDNSNWDEGYFFEGVMTKGAPTPMMMVEVQLNIVSAHYAGDLQP